MRAEMMRSAEFFIAPTAASADPPAILRDGPERAGNRLDGASETAAAAQDAAIAPAIIPLGPHPHTYSPLAYRYQASMLRDPYHRPGRPAVEVAGDLVEAVAETDPITLTGAGVGTHAVAVTGVRPRWFLACVLLPEGSTGADAEALFAGMWRTLDEVGATLVGGHTEVTGAVRQPIVVGQMLGFATERIVPTGGLRPGDAVVQIGPAPVEGAAVLADILSAERLRTVSSRGLEAARSALDTPGILVVEPALAAARAGATALHDPTEGGLSAGLHEMAEASGVALTVEPDRILWFGPGVELCAAAGLEPWGTPASGTLLAGFAPERMDAAVHDLAGAGHSLSVIGRAESGSGTGSARERAPCPVRARRAELPVSYHKP